MEINENTIVMLNVTMRLPFHPTPSLIGVLTIRSATTLLVGGGSGVLVTLTFIVALSTTMGASTMNLAILGGVTATTKLSTTTLARCESRRGKIANFLLEISNKANKVVSSDRRCGSIN